MKWNKPFQVMRVKDRTESQTEYETLIDGDDLPTLMAFCGQMLQGALAEKIKEREELEIWNQRDRMIVVLAHYFIYTK